MAKPRRAPSATQLAAVEAAARPIVDSLRHQLAQLPADKQMSVALTVLGSTAGNLLAPLSPETRQRAVDVMSCVLQAVLERSDARPCSPSAVLH